MSGAVFSACVKKSTLEHVLDVLEMPKLTPEPGPSAPDRAPTVCDARREVLSSRIANESRLASAPDFVKTP